MSVPGTSVSFFFSFFDVSGSVGLQLGYSPDKINSQRWSQAHAWVLRDEREELHVVDCRPDQEAVNVLRTPPLGAVHLLREPELSLDCRHHVKVAIGGTIYQVGRVCLVGRIP